MRDSTAAVRMADIIFFVAIARSMLTLTIATGRDSTLTVQSSVVWRAE